MTQDFNYYRQANTIGDIAKNEFKFNYNFDENNKEVFRLLLYYFNGLEQFETMRKNEGYSLRKGIMLMGGVGTGKTTMMKIFKKYCSEDCLKHNHFTISNIRKVNEYFKETGNIKKYTYCYQNSIKNRDKTSRNFCFDDFGTENKIVKHYGNDENPSSSLLLDRYLLFTDYEIKTHLTTNLSPETIKKKYGEEIASKMGELFNVIPLLGTDRRK